MRHSQSSIIELLIISIGVSIAITMILMQRSINIESIRQSGIESEETLINYLNYRPEKYNESFSILIQSPADFSNGSYLFNESIRVIELLNNNNSFILYTNKLNVYNKQETVCLKKARLAAYKGVTYGSWKGEAPLKC